MRKLVESKNESAFGYGRIGSWPLTHAASPRASVTVENIVRNIVLLASKSEVADCRRKQFEGKVGFILNNLVYCDA